VVRILMIWSLLSNIYYENFTLPTFTKQLDQKAIHLSGLGQFQIQTSLVLK